jgi:predicted metal-dependent HD superfamily phosphohydrolase
METLVKDIKDYVFSLLQEKLPATIIYHTYSHTHRVVAKIEELIIGEGVAEHDANLLRIAAWFHDVGYIDTIKGHEEKSVTYAKAYLDKKLSADDLSCVSALILSTKLEEKPKTHLQKIIKDADCSHVAAKSAEEISELLLQEFKACGVAQYSAVEWNKENVKFYTEYHQFYTDYALEHWQPRKQKNLLKLYKAIEKHEAEADEAAKNKKIKAAKADLPEKGVETMFRVTLRNHIKLSDIADTKANILLSVNAIIISIALGSLIPRLDNPSNAHLILPTMILILFSVITIIFAIQSTRPKVTEGKFTRADVEKKRVNLLFFGNFHQVPLQEFTWAVREMMQDKDYLYNSMIKDLYFLGIVLNRKYKLLRKTYTLFTIGIILSVVAFMIAFQFREHVVIPTR